jgi:hypothetical protein
MTIKQKNLGVVPAKDADAIYYKDATALAGLIRSKANHWRAAWKSDPDPCLSSAAFLKELMAAA